MIKLSEKSRRVIRAVYRGLGVSAVSLIFQACYGPVPDGGYDVTIHGTVKSKSTDAPIPGIRVSVNGESSYNLTESDGSFSIYMPRQDYYAVIFEDIDGTENGGLFKQHTKRINTLEAESSLIVELEEDAE